MKTVYFISNNLVNNIPIVYPDTFTLKEMREKTMLSLKGEKEAKRLCGLNEFSSIDIIYSSFYFGALSTSKYLAEEKNLKIFVDERLSERIVGDLGTNEYRYLKGMQEHDFAFKLKDGESLDEVKSRMRAFLKDILNSKYKNIIVVTHNIALLSLFLTWCNKGFSLEDRLILDYEEENIFDGSFHEIDLIKTEFEERKLVSITRLE